MAKLYRLKLIMENEEALVFPSDMVKFLEIKDTWEWHDPDSEDEEEPVFTFDSARICLSQKAAVRYPTACGISAITQLERIARFRDVMWIDLLYEDGESEVFFVPYVDETLSIQGSANSLMQTGWDKEGNFWVLIGQQRPIQE